MSATVSLESCVRSLSVKSECSKCKDVCGFEAINFNNYSVRIDASACTDCTACIGVCPSGAITLKESGLTALSADELFCVGVRAADTVVVSAPKELEESCRLRVDEANALLECFSLEPKIKLDILDEEKKEPDDASRRALFKMFTKSGIKAAHESVKSEEEIVSTIDYTLLKSKKIPPKREFFLSVVEGLELSDKNASIPLSFATDKFVDDSCDNCSLCYNLCPSGALETTGMKNAILFSSYLCLKCKLCEDVCETKSISSLPTFPLSEFKNRQKKLLKKFTVKLCNSCGAVFSADGEECPRCSLENEDAMELLGL
jgi:Fe-S-cluster-containing hydrogenase component 2